jgi:hypothetical protein
VFAHGRLQIPIRQPLAPHRLPLVLAAEIQESVGGSVITRVTRGKRTCSHDTNNCKPINSAKAVAASASTAAGPAQADSAMPKVSYE